jgi:glycopeptide antibiotics resistance protein
VSRLWIINCLGFFAGVGGVVVSLYAPGKLSMVLVLWLVCYCYAWFSGGIKRISRHQRIVFFLAFTLYLGISLATRFSIQRYWGTLPYFWLNRLEHLSFSIAAPFILLPILSRSYFSVSRRVLGLFIIGLVSLAGNVNEILEFVYRFPRTGYGNGLVFYLDTSFDIITNTIGAILAWLLFISIFRKEERVVKEKLESESGDNE